MSWFVNPYHRHIGWDMKVCPHTSYEVEQNERQTDRQTGRQTGRQTDRRTDGGMFIIF